jgi:hypothetical protein
MKNFQLVVDSFPASEFTESARQNIEICRKRLGAAQFEGTGTESEPPAPDSGQSAPSPAPIDRQEPQGPTQGENEQ